MITIRTKEPLSYDSWSFLKEEGHEKFRQKIIDFEAAFGVDYSLERCDYLFEFFTKEIPVPEYTYKDKDGFVGKVHGFDRPDLESTIVNDIRYVAEGDDLFVHLEGWIDQTIDAYNEATGEEKEIPVAHTFVVRWKIPDDPYDGEYECVLRDWEIQTAYDNGRTPQAEGVSFEDMDSNNQVSQLSKAAQWIIARHPEVADKVKAFEEYWGIGPEGMEKCRDLWEDVFKYDAYVPSRDYDDEDGYSGIYEGDMADYKDMDFGDGEYSVDEQGRLQVSMSWGFGDSFSAFCDDGPSYWRGSGCYDSEKEVEVYVSGTLTYVVPDDLEAGDYELVAEDTSVEIV